MIGSTLGILTASMLGSVHCAAMCGGFVCFYTGTAPGRASGGATGAASPSLVRAHALYNVGRLVSYVLLGAIAGSLGAGVSRIGALAGVGHAATIVAGVLMISWAVSTIAAQRGVHLGARLGAPTVPVAWQRLLGRLLQSLRDQPVGARALITGLATTLLPCGWLYVFVAAAGGTGRALDGMFVMALFWLGNVPALVAVGVGAQRVFGPFRRRLPTLGALTVLLMGVLAASGRLSMSASSVESGGVHSLHIMPGMQPEGSSHGH
jgi:sulfite exporter TauE/SafE